MTLPRSVWLLVLALCWPALGEAVQFESIKYHGKRLTICRVNLKTENLELFLEDESSHRLRTLANLQAFVARRGQSLVFGMNAGMYEPDRSPVGLFVAGGREVAPLNLKVGKGNFFLKPNGVFMVAGDEAYIVPSEQYPRFRDRVLLATQSGPMLVVAGQIHSAFNPGSSSLLIRNGVGVVSSRSVVFALTEDPMNLYEFATCFRDELHCQNALFLDGDVSSLFAPELNRNDFRIDLGPMIGVVKAESAQ